MAAHKYWRLINIVKRLQNPSSNYDYIEFAEVDFINIEAIATDNPNNVIFLNQYNSTSDKVVNMFDKKTTTSGASAKLSGQNAEWYVGYKFDVAVTVTHIKHTPRQDIRSDWGYELQTADVECSDDGVSWAKYGVIQPYVAAMDLSTNTNKVLRPSVVSGKSTQDNGIASRYVLINDWQTGVFIKKITPASDGSWQHNLPDDAPLLITHVGIDGFKPQADGGVTPIPIVE